MNTTTPISLIIGLIIGVAGALGISYLTGENSTLPTDTPPQAIVPTDHSTMSMTDMNTELTGLSGDEFDKLFIELMIAHHEGAVDMAELAESRALHEEIRSLSKAIISAQTQEILEMRQWYSDWGYATEVSTPMMHEAH